MNLLTVVLVTIVWVLLIWLISAYAGIQQPAKKIITIGMAIVLVLWLLFATNVVDWMRGVEM